MNEGFAKNVRMLLSDRSRLAANTARRINGNRTELRRAVYSPCDLCKSDPSAPPAWQLKAREIDHDKSMKIVEFRDAVMEIDGWPIFYAPYISTPDPSVKRASGFLAAVLRRLQQRRGAHHDPLFPGARPGQGFDPGAALHHLAGPVLGAEYRERFGNGELDAIGSLNYSNPDTAGASSGKAAARQHRRSTARSI